MPRDGPTVMRRQDPRAITSRTSPQNRTPDGTNFSWTELMRLETFRINEQITVNVAFVHPTDKIVCVQPHKNTGILMACQRKIEELSQDNAFSPFPSQDIQVGKLCCAKYHEDDLYYRAVITFVDHATKTAKLLFIDYGNIETTPFNEILVFDPSLIIFPILAIPVYLEKIDGLMDYTSDQMESLGQDIDTGYSMKVIKSAVKSTRAADTDEYQLYDYKYVVDISTQNPSGGNVPLENPAGSSTAPVAPKEPEPESTVAVAAAVAEVIEEIPVQKPISTPAAVVAVSQIAPEVVPAPTTEETEAPVTDKPPVENLEVKEGIVNVNSGDSVASCPTVAENHEDGPAATNVIATTPPATVPDPVQIASPPPAIATAANGTAHTQGSLTPPSMMRLSNSSVTAGQQLSGQRSNGNGNGRENIPMPGQSRSATSSMSGSTSASGSRSGSSQFQFQQPMQPIVFPTPETLNSYGIPIPIYQTHGQPIPGFAAYVPSMIPQAQVQSSILGERPRTPSTPPLNAGQFQMGLLNTRVNELLGHFDAMKAWISEAVAGPEGSGAGASISIPMHQVHVLVPTLLESMRIKDEKIVELENELEVYRAEKAAHAARAKMQLKNAVVG